MSMVRFENWLVYSYWNSKSKKTEVGVLTAYEGAIDKSELNPWTSRSPNATGSGESFSSYHATSQAAGAIIMERLYEMSTGVRTLGVTTTAKGITSKNVLFGLKSGQILSLDTRFLDPRRPAEKPTKEQQAEMLFQYHPNLPVVPQKVITYHKTVENLRHITSFLQSWSRRPSFLLAVSTCSSRAWRRQSRTILSLSTMCFLFFSPLDCSPCASWHPGCCARRQSPSCGSDKGVSKK